MALESIGFALGAIPELRHQVISIQKRIANIAEGPAIFQGLTSKLDGMAADVKEIESIIGKEPNVVPGVSSAMFRRRLDSVQKCLQTSENALDVLSKDAFPGSSSGKRKKIKLMFKRVLRADSIAEKMSCVAEQVGEAASELRGLVSTLAMLVKMERMSMKHGEVSAEPHYKPDGSTPALAPTVTLDYISKDARGSFVTPEGELKYYVLSSASSSSVTAAAGVVRMAGVVGMAGVGKTIALQGLAHEEEVQARFPHGIHYISLGHSATLQNVIKEVGKVMRITGAAGIAHNVESSVSLREAIDYAVTWFRGKVCLFLIDDLWPTADCTTGYLNDLRQLLRGSPESRMAITTRNHDIAHAAGSVVDFAARDPLGPVSERIFMAFAVGSLRSEQSSVPSHERRSSVSKILSICGGLPIALSVAGCAVAFLLKANEDFESACDAYSVELEKTKISIGERQGPGGTSLKAGIFLSLRYLDAEFEEWKKDNAPEMMHTVTHLYTGLCVLQNQTWIPVSVLCRLWNVDEDCAFHVLNRICAMSLATLHCRKSTHVRATEPGLILHDLHLEFCQRQAERTHTVPFWHRQLLNGYLGARSSSVATTANFPTEETLEEEDILTFSPRPWWSSRIPEDGYIHANLARHLACSNQALELAALLLDAQWTHLRVSNGGIVALRMDFTTLQIFASPALSDESRDSFYYLLKALQLSWGSTVHGERALLFHVCGRVHGLRKTNAIVRAFLKSIENCTARPYLLPMNQFAGTLHSGKLMEIPTKAPCLAVACSPCGRYFAAGGGADVFVIDAKAGIVLKKLQGHILEVTAVRFAGKSGKLVSGSQDKRIMVWDWKKYDRAVQSLEGHTERITCLAISSDGKQIFSGSEDLSLRTWDIETGDQTSMHLQRSSVCSVCLFADDRKVVVGLLGGDLKVFDTRTRAVIFDGIYARPSGFMCTALSPDGQLLAASDGYVIQLWDTQTWRREEYFQEHNSTIHSIGFSPDGEISSGSQDGRIRVLDIASLETIAESPDVQSSIQSVDSIGFSPDGEISSGSQDERVSDIASLETIAESPDVQSSIQSVEFIRAGEQIICALASGTVQVWDCSLAGEYSIEEIRHQEEVSYVDISPDGLHAATASYDGEIKIWNTETVSQLHFTFESRTARCVSFSPIEGKLLYSCDEDLFQWDLYERDLLEEEKVLIGHSSPATCVSHSFDGLRAVSGHVDNTVRIWNLQSRQQIGDALQGPKSAIHEVSESIDGHYIVSKSGDGETFIWNHRGREVAWTSDKTVVEKGGIISDEEAATVIRSCGKLAHHLWPEWLPEFPRCTSEVAFSGDTLYTDASDGQIILGVWAPVSVWKYNLRSKIFAAGLKNGGIAICRFIS